MKFSYKIVYDIEKDIWNWLGGGNSSFFDKSNINNIDNKDDAMIAQKIIRLDETTAKEVLRPYLLTKKDDKNSKLNQFIKLAKIDFSDKYDEACLVLEKITNKRFIPGKFVFYVTTFPRMPYFYETREIFLYASTDDFWGMPIDGFLHEGLHFQFTKYWRNNQKSPVSKLTDNDFDYLKEALTVVLDESLQPLIVVPDTGYPNQANFRKTLHKEWLEHYDFNKLVDFGLKNYKVFLNGIAK